MENIKGDASPRYFAERAYTPATADKGGTDYCYIGRATAAMEKADDTDEVSQDKVYRFHIYDSLEEAVCNAGVPIRQIGFIDPSEEEYAVFKKMLDEDINGGNESVEDLLPEEYTGRYYVEKAFIPAGAATPETNYCRIGRATVDMEEHDGDNFVGHDDMYKFHLYNSIKEAIQHAAYPEDMIEFVDLLPEEMEEAHRLVQSIIADWNGK